MKTVLAEERFNFLSAENKAKMDNLFIPMSVVPGAEKFPIGINDVATCTSVNYPYKIAKSAIAYKLWTEVYRWAVMHNYFFENAGNIGSNNAGSEQQPVTALNWRDAIVGCNALTEYYNIQNNTKLTCVYQYSGEILRDSRDCNRAACDNQEADVHAGGFRLPTSMEWELAARFISPGYYIPGNYASGATADYQDKSATMETAWYEDNSKMVTQPVGEKTPNSSGLYDMAGNVWEWCFDLYGLSHRIARGGSCYDVAFVLQSGFYISCAPHYAHNSFGFRPVMGVPE